MNCTCKSTVDGHPGRGPHHAPGCPMHALAYKHPPAENSQHPHHESVGEEAPLAELAKEAVPTIDAVFKYLEESGLAETSLKLWEAVTPLAELRARFAAALLNQPQQVSSSDGVGEQVRAPEVGGMLDEIQEAVTACHYALAEDPGCTDPDRTMVPFEELRSASKRLDAALTQQQPTSVQEGRQ